MMIPDPHYHTQQINSDVETSFPLELWKVGHEFLHIRCTHIKSNAYWTGIHISFITLDR